MAELNPLNKPIPTLKKISAVKFVSCILSKIYYDVPLDDENTQFNDKTREFDTEAKVKTYLKLFFLPHRIKEEVLFFTKCMCSELFFFPLEELSFCKIKNNLCISCVVWNSFGIIDDTRTLMNIHSTRSNKQNNSCECVICLQIEFSKKYILQYENYHNKGICELDINYEQFYQCLTPGTNSMLKCFWAALSEKDKLQCFYEFASRYELSNTMKYIETFLFTLSTFSDDELKRIFQKFSKKIFYCVVRYWPWPQAILLILRKMIDLNYIIPSRFIYFCKKVLTDVLLETPIYFKTNEIFVNIWVNFSNEIAKGMECQFEEFTAALELQSIINYLYDPDNEIKLRMIKILIRSDLYKKLRNKIIFSESTITDYYFKEGWDSLVEFLNILEVSQAEIDVVSLMFNSIATL